MAISSGQSGFTSSGTYNSFNPSTSLYSSGVNITPSLSPAMAASLVSADPNGITRETGTAMAGTGSFANAVGIGSLKNSPLTLPSATQVPNYWSEINAGNYGLGLTNLDGSQKAPVVTTPTVGTASKTEAPKTTSITDIMSQYFGAKAGNAAPNTEAIQKQAEIDSGVIAQRQIVNDLTARINTITARATANTLQVTGQGRGVPEAIIGGQQAEIQKQAAIEALPLQAELAAAQGNLKMAEDRLNTLFTVRSTDATNQYNTVNSLIESVKDFADEQQKNALADKKTQEQNAFTLKLNNINFAQDLTKTALANGDAATAAKIAKIDPSSPTFDSQIAMASSGMSGGTGGKIDESKVLLSQYENRLLGTPDGTSIAEAKAKIPNAEAILKSTAEQTQVVKAGYFQVVDTLNEVGIKDPSRLTVSLADKLSDSAAVAIMTGYYMATHPLTSKTGDTSDAVAAQGFAESAVAQYRKQGGQGFLGSKLVEAVKTTQSVYNTRVNPNSSFIYAGAENTPMAGANVANAATPTVDLSGFNFKF